MWQYNAHCDGLVTGPNLSGYLYVVLTPESADYSLIYFPLAGVERKRKIRPNCDRVRSSFNFV